MIYAAPGLPPPVTVKPERAGFMCINP